MPITTEVRPIGHGPTVSTLQDSQGQITAKQTTRLEKSQGGEAEDKDNSQEQPGTEPDSQTARQPDSQTARKQPGSSQEAAEAAEAARK